MDSVYCLDYHSLMNNILGIGLLALIIGLGGGYFFADSGESAPMVHDMHTTMEGMTGNLEGKAGAAFEQAFLEEMIVHHEGAVVMAQMVLEKTERPELVQLANDIISAQTSEIALMRQWQASW